VTDPEALAAVAALADPVRRRIYEGVRRAHDPITRDEAAAGAGISRNLATFHLDKLVAAGLLRVEAAAGRAGRVGRRPKVYLLAATEVAVTIPQREYELAAEVLADALTQLPAPTASAAVEASACDRGRRAGEAAAAGLRGRLGLERAMTATTELLEACGFAPRSDDDGTITFGNCPFHRLAERSRTLICGLNHAYVRGVLEGLGSDRVLDAELAPMAGRCCVRVRPASGA
jgi:predicted ArsR family transcriptional regulator